MTVTYLSMSAVRNAPGVSITATYRPSVASIAAVTRTDSVAAVGEVTSIFFYPSLCFRPSTKARNFIFPHRFFLKNISTHSAPFFCFFVSFPPLIGWNTTLSCICCISDLVAFITSFPNLFSPCFRFSCVKMRTMRLVKWSLGYLCSKLGWWRGRSLCLWDASHTH